VVARGPERLLASDEGGELAAAPQSANPQLHYLSAVLAVFDGSLPLAAMFAIEPPSSSDPTNDCVGDAALFSMRFVSSSCRSAARTSRARFAEER